MRRILPARAGRNTLGRRRREVRCDTRRAAQRGRQTPLQREAARRRRAGTRRLRAARRRSASSRAAARRSRARGSRRCSTTCSRARSSARSAAAAPCRRRARPGSAPAGTRRRRRSASRRSSRAPPCSPRTACRRRGSRAPRPRSRRSSPRARRIRLRPSSHFEIGICASTMKSVFANQIDPDPALAHARLVLGVDGREQERLVAGGDEDDVQPDAARGTARSRNTSR